MAHARGCRRFEVEPLPSRRLLNAVYHSLSAGPLVQDWSQTSLISTANDWSNVPSIIGYRGEDIVTVVGVDPQTVIGFGSGVHDVSPNKMSPNTQVDYGVTEFEGVWGTIALAGNPQADAPFLLFHLDATGQSAIPLSFSLRDITSDSTNSVSRFAVQYRLGNAGDFINIPEGFVADATLVNSATKVTNVSLTLPAAVNNQPVVQVRIITTNGSGADGDEWVGVDDIVVGQSTTAVTVTQQVFDFDGLNQPPAVTVDFSAPIQPADAADFSIVDRNTLAPVGFAVQNVSSTRVKLTFTGSNGAPPDGNLQMTIQPTINAASGGTVTPPLPLPFAFLQGDANSDGKTGTADFNLLAGAFGLSGQTFSDGNFNFSGSVDSSDFAVLASQYGKKLLPPPTLLPATGLFSTLTLVSDDLDSAVDCDLPGLL